MNKLTSIILASTLLLAGCGSSNTVAVKQTAPVPAATVAQEAAPPSEPVVPQQEIPTDMPHPGPFKGNGWALAVDETWLGREVNGDLEAIHRDPKVKVMIMTQTTDKSLQALVVENRMNLAEHGVETDAVKLVAIDGVKGATFLSHQGPVNAYLTIFSTKVAGAQTAILFACGGRTTTKELGSFCADIRNQIHFVK